jgi:Flp pilus assembly protein TadD
MARRALAITLLLFAACAASKGPAHDAPDVTTLKEQGKELARQHDFPGAIAKFQAACNAAPNDVEAQGMLGVAYISTSQYERAESQLKLAMQLGPSEAWLYGPLGTLYVRQGRFGEAEQVFRKLAELEPTDPRPYGSLGQIGLQTKDYKLCVDGFDKYVALLGDPAFIAERDKRGYQEAMDGAKLCRSKSKVKAKR